MISKGEAIMRLKKMGVAVADDQSIVTIILPPDVSLVAGIRDIKDKLKSMEYTASFCIRQSKDAENVSSGQKDETDEEKEVFDDGDDAGALSEEDLRGSFLSMDEDGQFTLDGLGISF